MGQPQNFLGGRPAPPPNKKMRNKPKGVQAEPGTPGDPKSHLFVTNWVAIQPFFKPKPGLYAEFRRGSRQIGPTPSISTFFRPFFDPKTAQKLKKCDFLTCFRKNVENRPGWDKMALPQGPGGPFWDILGTPKKIKKNAENPPLGCCN